MRRPNDRPSNKAGADEVEVNAEHYNPYTGAVRKHDELCDFDAEDGMKRDVRRFRSNNPIGKVGTKCNQRPRS